MCEKIRLDSDTSGNGVRDIAQIPAPGGGESRPIPRNPRTVLDDTARESYYMYIGYIMNSYRHKETAGRAHAVSPIKRDQTEGYFLEQEYDTIDLMQILNLIKRNLLVIIAAVVLFAAAGFGYTTFLVTPQYEASAMLIVNPSEQQQIQSTVTNDQINSAKQLVETYAVILKSDTVLNRTIDDLGLSLTYDQLAAKVSISAVNETQVMRISVQDENVQRAEKIVQSIVDQAPEVIISTVKAGSVEVVSEPAASPDPVSPNKRMNTLVAGMLGGVLAMGVIVLRSMLNNKIMTDEDITQKLGLPVLGVIPDNAACARKRGAKQK